MVSPPLSFTVLALEPRSDVISGMNTDFINVENGNADRYINCFEYGLIGTVAFLLNNLNITLELQSKILLNNEQVHLGLSA